MKGQKKCLLWITMMGLVSGLVGCGTVKEEGNTPRYPLEAVELIAPAGRGSGYDLTVRSVSQCLLNTGIVPVPLPVTNKPGGGGEITLKYLEEKRGCDDVISIFSPPLCLINLNGSTEFNYVENTTPIAQLIVDYGCISVRADSPYQTLGQLMDQLKADPKSVRVGGTSSIGSMDHLQFLKIARAAGVGNLKDISYEGFENGGSVTQLMGDRVDVLSTGISDVVGLVESGDIRVLAVTSGKRLDGDVISHMPTCREQGIDAEFAIWRGLFGPGDMPDDAVEYWENVLCEMAESEEWKLVCERYGWTMEYRDHEEFNAFLETKNEEYRDLLEEVGLLDRTDPQVHRIQ